MILESEATALIERFINEACIVDPTAAEPQTRLYEDFRYWAIRKGGLKFSYPFCIGKNQFTNILIKFGYEKTTGCPERKDYHHVYIYGLKSLLSDRL